MFSSLIVQISDQLNMSLSHSGRRGILIFFLQIVRAEFNNIRIQTTESVMVKVCGYSNYFLDCYYFLLFHVLPDLSVLTHKGDC